MQRCVTRKNSKTKRCSLDKKRGTPCFLFRDPKTKRCTKRCDSVINKRTNRCVLRKGRVGKSLRGKLTKCRSFRNQQTGRCITKRKRMSRQQKKSKRGSSRSHKRGSRKRKSNHTRGSSRKRRSGRSSGRKIKPLMCIPRKFEGIVEECECIKRWKKQTHQVHTVPLTTRARLQTQRIASMSSKNSQTMQQQSVNLTHTFA